MKLTPSSHDTLVANLAARLQKQSGKPAHVYRTHISSVIVCGKHAYKLKRPVKLAFVDFSTLSLRREDCKRELRINQRTAPTLYLDVIKITGSLQNPRLSGPGQAIDWAVKMRRFKQSSLLSHLVDRDALNTRTAEKLGQHLAAFAKATPGLPVQTIQAHRATIDWLCESLDEIIAVFASQRQQAQSIATWAKRQTLKHQHLIKHRMQQGFYRDGHGDLHLGNLVKLDKTVVAFDALEFNKELSQIDTVNDIAFTFMDLLAHHRPGLAWSMVNQWCEHTGDYDGLSLLRYYTLYRAVVRAKVAALTDGQANTRAFDRYWDLAIRLIGNANPPRLILVGGISGSGKSTVAKTLVSALSGIQVRADVVRKQLFAHLIHEPEQLYSKAASQRTYARMAQIADRLLASHMTVIVDATFLAQSHLDQFARLANKHQIELRLFWCEAPVTVLKRRIKKRAKQGLDPSDATITVLEQQIERLKTHRLAWPNLTTQINTNRSHQSVTRHIHRIAHRLTKSQ